MNLDGDITALDALGILSHVVGKPLPAGFIVDPNGDVNCDGHITALDALITLSYVVGKDVSQFCIGDIIDGGPTTITTTSPLPGARVGLAYSMTLTAEGGDGSYVWTLFNGTTLPAGLELKTTGEISGTPTEYGVTDFEVEVTSAGQSDTEALQITVLLVLQPSDLCSDRAAPSWSFVIATFADATLEAAVRDALSAGPAAVPVARGLSSVSEVRAAVELERRQATSKNTNPKAGTPAMVPAAALVGEEADLSCDLVTGLTALTSNDTYLSGSGIASLVGIQNLTGLTDLDLKYNVVTDISPLSGLTGLTDLDLSRNSIADISVLSGLTSLTDLDIGFNSISDITPLSGLTGLERLLMSSNSITDIGALSELSSLRTLFFSYNSITDISVLSGFGSLTYASLSQNGITDIGALSALTSMRLLWLADNEITDVSALRGLTNLSRLDLADNSSLADIQPLLDNTGLGAGDVVILTGTSVNCTDVTALRAKGVTVTSDCPVEPQTIASISVTPTSVSLTSLGATQALTAEALDSAGNVIAGVDFTWASSDDTVATVSSAGLVTAAAVGTTSVTATADSVTSNAVTVTVTAGLVLTRLFPAGGGALDTVPQPSLGWTTLTRFFGSDPLVTEWEAVLGQDLDGNAYGFTWWLAAGTASGQVGTFTLQLLAERDGAVTELASTTFEVPYDSLYRHFTASVSGVDGGVDGDKLTLRATVTGVSTASFLYGGESDSHVLVPGDVTVTPLPSPPVPVGQAQRSVRTEGAANDKRYVR